LKNNEALEKFFEDSPSLKQLSNKPGVVAAMAELAKVLQGQGCCNLLRISLILTV